MTDYLVVRLLADKNAEWVVVDDQGTRRSDTGRGSLGDAAAAASGRRVIALVPGAHVLTVTTDLPVRGNRLLAALPYALEEQLADDVDTLHFAPGERLDDGTLPVAVVSRARLEGWLDALETVGLEPARVVADYHGVPSLPNACALVVSHEEVMFSDGRGLQFSLPETRPVDAVAAAGLIGSESDDDKPALQIYCDAALDEQYAADWAAMRHELSDVDVKLLPDGMLPRLAVSVASGGGINLLQGRFGEKTDYAALWRPWRLAASLAAGLVLVSSAGMIVDYLRLGQEEAALREQFNTLYRELQPGDTREVRDPVATVNSLRRQFGTGGDVAPVFLPSLQALADAVSAAENTKIEAISYRAGVVDVMLSAPDVTTLDKIQQEVASGQRFNATIQSTTQTNEGLDGRLQIREAGA